MGGSALHKPEMGSVSAGCEGVEGEACRIADLTEGKPDLGEDNSMENESTAINETVNLYDHSVCATDCK